VFAETEIPAMRSSAAIFSVVLLVHFNPLIGSPAVSFFRRSEMRERISGVFFHGFAATPGFANPPRIEAVFEKFEAALGDGRRIQPEQFRDEEVAAPTKFDRFESSEEASLLLIEEAQE